MEKPTCFLICPIGHLDTTVRRRSTDLLNLVIKPAMQGFKFIEFLTQKFEAGIPRGIRESINEAIQHADVCIADLTGNNPNVLFEYGLRLKTGRPVLPVVQKGEEGNLVYDINDYPTLIYDLDHPGDAASEIRKFVDVHQAAGFGWSEVQIEPVRKQQAPLIYQHIEQRKPRRVDIMQFSMLALDNIWDSLRKTPDTLVRLLLLHPDEGKKYALGKFHSDEILNIERILRLLPQDARLHPDKPCPTVGLWYYRHEPSVAAVIIDDELVQLGWYFRYPAPGKRALLVRGHDRPGVLALGQHAARIIPAVRDHFLSVFRAAEPANPNWELCIGPHKNQLRKEWEKEKKKTPSAQL